MKYKKIEDCTLLLITHERSELLKKSLDYYENFFTEIKVLDSSLKENRNIANQIEYYHCKKYTIIQKVLLGLSKTKTKFTIISPDDDFFFPDSIKAGISYLKKNSNFVSVSGNYYSFERLDSLKKFNLMYKSYYKDISDALPLNRIKKICTNPIAQMTYNVLKTKIIFKSLSRFKLFKQANFIEDVLTLATILFGKHKYLDINWMIRDGSVNTKYESSNSHKGLFNYKKKNSKIIFRKFLKSYFDLLSKNNFIIDKKIVENYLKKYFSRSRKQTRFFLRDGAIVKVLKKIYKIFWYSIFSFRYLLFFSKREREFINIIFK